MDWTMVEPEGIIEPVDAIVVGNRIASEGLKSRTNEWRLLRHWWGGVFPDSAFSPPILTH